ncbi:PREDICTED: voltage-dependent anion-selective channel protein 1-like [Polistes canadensis]|uniref:voltage-dependent anion-selective channel protein 1-like n=1 Tax=Polistes canadensis TaxID=91411 RepID=UPI000718F24C|nr:PREDICTED: voltage-dependent anion-selective channel protein 1-like [Polistes canadensis]
MEVPNFSDLGKSARDVFKTGYYYGKGLFKLNVKSKKTGIFEMTSDLFINADTLKLNGLLETKYNTENYGNIVQKWTSDGTAFLGCEMTGKLLDGLTLLSEFFYNPQTTFKGMKLDTKYINDRVNGICTLANENFDSNLNVYGAIVVRFKELFVGYQCGYKTATKELTKNDLGFAFGYRDLAFHLRCTLIPHEFGCSVLYKVNSDWDIALNGISAKSGRLHKWMVGVAAKYKLDEDSILRFKMNNAMQLGTSLQLKLNENATVSFSFCFDCTNINRGNHKVGMGYYIEA